MKEPFISLDIQQKKHISEARDSCSLQDEYTTFLSHSITRILKRWPDHFESDLFKEFNRFVGHLDISFGHHRHISHLSKLFCSHYLMRKSLNRALHFSPQKRKVGARLIHAQLQLPFKVQPVLGIIATISLQEQNERFGEKHMTSAILAIIPGAEILKKSFYSCQSNLDSVHTFYLEVAKKDENQFSLAERKLLKQSLPHELAKRVETLDSATFNLHREEELLKNIALLKRELDSTPDFPQIMIFFAAQDPEYLSFQIILLRTLKKNTAPLNSCFAFLPVQFVADRTKLFHNVEANIFQLRIPIDSSLLRTDFSLNLYQARYKVLLIIQEAVGKVRDYNGGLFVQQKDLFSEFKNALPEAACKDSDLLENFFHALSPTHMQAILHVDTLRDLFTLLLKALEAKLFQKEEYFLKFQNTEFSFLAIIRADDSSFKQHIIEALQNEPGVEEALASVSLTHRGSHYLAYIYHFYDKPSNARFQHAIEQGIKAWQEKIASFQSLRLSAQTLPVSFDPRIGGDEVSKAILKLMFEGLTRIGKEERLEYALAEKVEISPNGKCYLFTLKETFWSNGDKVTAHDFAYAWKKILSPSFSSAFAHLFYPIKNAQAAKEARAGIEDVGIKVIDKNTLKVELEHPCPYFLELIAHSLYSPINAKIDVLYPQWSSQEGKSYVCNGPFQLKKVQSEGCELIKNPLYWDSKQIRLDQILIVKANFPVACQLFKKGEVDWLGRPLQPWHPLFLKSLPKPAQALPGPSVFWVVFNVQCFPFNHLKIRQALAFVLKRQALIDALHYPGCPAFSPLPCDQRQYFDDSMSNENTNRSQLLFQEALQEMGLHPKEFPAFTLIHNKSELREKTAQAIQQQWAAALDIQCATESYAWEDFFHHMSTGNFQVGLINWRSVIDDPAYTLNAFRYPHENINFAKWDHPEYQALLQKADQEHCKKHRLALLKAAENILVQELPVIPLFDEVNPYIKKKKLAGIFSTHSSNINFRNAYFLKKSKQKVKTCQM